MQVRNNDSNNKNLLFGGQQPTIVYHLAAMLNRTADSSYQT
jgi:hypothetical protein